MQNWRVRAKAVVASLVGTATVVGVVVSQNLLHGSALHYATSFISIVGVIAIVAGVNGVSNAAPIPAAARRKSSKPHA